MTTQLLTRNVDSQTRTEATEVTAEVHDRHIVGAFFKLDDGSEIILPPQLSDLMAFVLRGVTQGDLRIESIPDVLTTRTASEMLGISRPTLMKMVREGVVPSHKVGSHHRFMFDDIARVRADREERRAVSLRRLFDLEFEHGIED